MNSTSLRSRHVPPHDKRRRVCRVFIGAGILLLAGGLYALWLMLGGPGIPCIFHVLTGLDCPSCGITHLCLSLLRLDFSAAWQANAAILCLMPVGLVVAVRMLWRYIQTGQTRPERWVSVFIWGMIAVLLLFGVVRNVI